MAGSINMHALKAGIWCLEMVSEHLKKTERHDKAKLLVDACGDLGPVRNIGELRAAIFMAIGSDKDDGLALWAQIREELAQINPSQKIFGRGPKKTKAA